MRNYPADEHKYRDVVRVHRERFVRRRIHLVELLLLKVGIRQSGIHLFGVAARGIFLEILFAHLDLLVERVKLHIRESLVGLFFFRVDGGLGSWLLGLLSASLGGRVLLQRRRR